MILRFCREILKVGKSRMKTRRYNDHITMKKESSCIEIRVENGYTQIRIF